MSAVAEQTDIQRDLQALAAELRQLEVEYTMFFAGRLPRPPWETRARVEAIIKRWDRPGRIESSADRFRFDTLQSRFSTFADLWDRGMRAREEGRPGPFSRPAQAQAASAKSEDRVLYVASFKDPKKEMDKLHDLYQSLMDARREVGEKVVPFHKFADLVREQVKQLRSQGNPEVAFRVAVKDGQVSLTARALKGMPE